MINMCVRKLVTITIPVNPLKAALTAASAAGAVRVPGGPLTHAV